MAKFYCPCKETIFQYTTVQSKQNKTGDFLELGPWEVSHLKPTVFLKTVPAISLTVVGR